MPAIDIDDYWMQRALLLAERGRGAVEPNPLVGAVVVQPGEPGRVSAGSASAVSAGRSVGEGWHQRYGGPHAEVNALQAAGEAARGATLYVTLEPCCHHGKTPPCTGAVLQAGIARVVAALVDPFPQVSGGGTERLRAAGVKVDVGIGEREARIQNAPYLKLLEGQPYVHAKWAMTLDGKLATRTGDSRWISNEQSRQRVHLLRGRVDAVLVGIGTALADDPQLTARPPGPRLATRIVLDTHARLPVTGALARTAREVPVLLAVGEEAPADRLRALADAGCEVLRLPAKAGRVVLGALLAELGRRRMTNLLVEGGGQVLGSFFDAGALDEMHVFIAPRLVGGAGAPTALAGVGVEKMVQAWLPGRFQSETLGGDLYVHAFRAGGV
jgi:diaminohydroxyphosphoribosylaminopyrimidine deaminase/5-amino-6-(5-phosphoribosylamino)uracil reductase